MQEDLRDAEPPEDVGLSDVLITDEFARRPSRPPDYKAENEALRTLARCIAEHPEDLLRYLVNVAKDLLRAGTAGMCLHEKSPGGEEFFRWVALAGAYEAYTGWSISAEFSPCAVCLEQRAPQLYAYPGRYFTYFNEVDPPIVEALVVPFPEERDVPGAIWIFSHDERRKFDAEDARVMTSLVDFAAIALRLSDLRERQRTAEELRESEERFRLIMHSGQMFLWDIDLISGRVNFSDGAPALFGYEQPPQSWHHLDTIHEAFHVDDQERIRRDIEAATQGSGTFFFSVGRFKTATDDHVWFEGRGMVRCDASGRPIRMIGIALNIDERKRAEEVLREADRRKDEFLATLAHELRNPLAPIHTGIQLLRRSGAPFGDTRGIQELLERQVNHLIRLVDDLLDMSRIARGTIELRREYVELADIIESAVETTKPLIDIGNHRLLLSLPEQPVVLHADPVRLAQVFANLINNAATYTDRGGEIHLRVRRLEERVVVSVEDTGIGIPDEMIPHIFDVFKRGDHPVGPAHAGLGIGLALVRNLVELHGGSVEARSDGPGTGAEFFVSLPLNTCCQVPAATPHVDNGCTLSSQLRVLLVDDNRDLAEALGMLLESIGVEVKVANSGPAALKVLEDYGPNVVLLDIGLPEMDGFEVARRIRKHPEFQDVTIIALTGWGSEEDRRRSQIAGFDYHLTKPVDIDDLQSLLDSLDLSASLPK